MHSIQYACKNIQKDVFRKYDGMILFSVSFREKSDLANYF